jgi:hypothetical protein
MRSWQIATASSSMEEKFSLMPGLLTMVSFSPTWEKSDPYSLVLLRGRTVAIFTS